MMMTIHTIYKCTNVLNGKSYIGYTSKSLSERIGKHKWSVSRNSKFKFHNALRKYGWENFIWETIYQSLDGIHTHKVMESEFIIQFDTIDNGYNIQNGGEGFDSETAKRIQGTPEARRRNSEAQKKAQTRPDVLENNRKKAIERNLDPEYRKRNSEAQLKIWEDELYRLSRCDQTEYTFTHRITGETHTSIVRVFVEKFNLDWHVVRKMVRGIKKSHRNWIVANG